MTKLRSSRGPAVRAAVIGALVTLASCLGPNGVAPADGLGGGCGTGGAVAPAVLTPIETKSVLGGPACQIVVREEQAKGPHLFGEPAFYVVQWQRVGTLADGTLRVSVETDQERFALNPGGFTGSPRVKLKGRVLLELSGFEPGKSADGEVRAVPRRVQSLPYNRKRWGGLPAWSSALPVPSGDDLDPDRADPVISATPLSDTGDFKSQGFRLRVEYLGEYATLDFTPPGP